MMDVVMLLGGPCDGEDHLVREVTMGLDFVSEFHHWWYARPYRHAEWMQFCGWLGDE
jgi:hypothetical protein